MSFVVFAIGAAHALPPILGAALGKSKRGVWIGVAIAALIAVASGNPAFVAMDLIGVALGAWMGLSMLEQKPDQ
jgi:threonine/homoserine/homoserine lactone efflux protein